MFRLTILFLLLASPAVADDCPVVTAAMAKMTTVSSHQLSRSITDNASRQTETIVVGKDMYVNTNGVWTRTAFDAGKIAEEQKTYYQGATCAAGKTSTIDDEPVRVYTISTPSENSEVWISATTGLPVKQTVNKNGDIRQVEFEYTNVKAPTKKE
jgi:hypothetical protein